MHRREYLLGAAGIAGASTVGSIAYTSAEVSRDVTAGVADDSTAIIGLSPGSVDAVSKSGGQLVIDTTNEPANINSGATFTYGDKSSPTTTPAFTVTNNDDAERGLSVDLSGTNLPGSSAFSISLYDGSAKKLGSATVSSASGSDSIGYSAWSKDETVYAVLEFVTDGTTGGDTIDATITFSA